MIKPDWHSVCSSRVIPAAQVSNKERKESYIMDKPTNTAIGVFDDYAEAERVAQDLTRAGIPRESVEVRSNFMTGAAGRSQPAQSEREGGISGFFHRLFGGNEDEYSDHYAEAIRRGSTVVCVTAPADRIDDAVKIMNEHGAVDVD